MFIISYIKWHLFWRWLYHATHQVKTQQIFLTVNIYLLYLCARLSFIWFNLILMTTQWLNSDAERLSILPKIHNYQVPHASSESRVWHKWALKLHHIPGNSCKSMILHSIPKCALSCLATPSNINTTNRFKFEGWWLICIK